MIFLPCFGRPWSPVKRYFSWPNSCGEAVLGSCVSLRIRALAGSGGRAFHLHRWLLVSSESWYMVIPSNKKTWGMLKLEKNHPSWWLDVSCLDIMKRYTVGWSKCSGLNLVHENCVQFQNYTFYCSKNTATKSTWQVLQTLLVGGFKPVETYIYYNYSQFLYHPKKSFKVTARISPHIRLVQTSPQTVVT